MSYPLSVSCCLWRKKQVWLSKLMNFSSAGRRAALPVTANLEFWTYWKSMFFEVSNHETSTVLLAFLPTFPVPKPLQHSSLWVNMKTELYWFVAPFPIAVGCICPSCYSQAHTLSMSPTLDILLNWVVRATSPCWPLWFAPFWAAFGDCPTSQSVNSKHSTPLSCLPALLLNLPLGKDKFTADLLQ